MSSSATSHGSAASAAEPAPVRREGFRPELHGLRGVAIALVVIYHVWLGRVSGGVDVFLFISAFLLTGTFLRRIDRDEPLQPLAYWARTFKRLLPPAAIVVLATLAGVFALLPGDRWLPALTDAAGSLLQVQNWVLVQRGTDYYAMDDSVASAFQHFWSLSIQGQVFLIWPVMIAATVLLARLLRIPARRVLAIVLTIITLTSLTWSVHSTAVQQTVAYFDTAARIWEFSAGGLLALALVPRAASGIATGSPSAPSPAGSRGRRRASRSATLPQRVAHRLVLLRVMLGWIGLLGLISCGLLLDVQGAFPGWIALWPLTAAALVLTAGATGKPWSADRLLSTSAARFLGDVSYALYLVHWPLLTLYLAAVDRPRAGLADGAVLVIVALVLAWLLTRLVDAPIRRWGWANARPWRSGIVVTTALVLGLAPVAAAHQHLHAQQREAELRAVSDNPGARVLEEDFEPHPDADPDAPVLPTAAMVTKDWVSGSDPCSGELAPTRSEQEALEKLCLTVPPDGSAASTAQEDAPVLVSVGDSRLEQASGALIPLAQREGWTVVTLWKGGCTYAPDAQVSEECDAFSEAAHRYIERVQPEAVMVASTFVTNDEQRVEVVSPGMEQTLSDLAAVADQVIALRALPRLPLDPVQCMQEHGADDPRCAAELPDDLAGERPDAHLLEEREVGAGADGAGGADVVPLDLNPLVCPERACRPVVGNVMVFIDAGHVSGTYAESMQGTVDTQLQDGGFVW